MKKYKISKKGLESMVKMYMKIINKDAYINNHKYLMYQNEDKN